MNSTFARKLTALAREHKHLKPVLFAVLVVYLIFYNTGAFLFEHKKQLAWTACICVVFFGTVSFTPSGDAASGEEEKVYFYNEEGVMEVDELKLSDLAAASGLVSADDIEQSLGRISQGRDDSKDRNALAAEDTYLYDEEEGMVRASYDDDWSLILINKTHRLPADYEFELSTIKGAIKSDVRVMPHVLEMINAAKEDGIIIKICSPYRDLEKQEALFKKKMRGYLRKDYSYQEAYELAAQTVAIPGTSEHQAGLAFDFISDDFTLLEPGFADTDAGKWLKKNCADYGFILRYPKGKEDITGIEFEPWHYRYVGAAAREITDRGLTLEEYDKEIGLTD